MISSKMVKIVLADINKTKEELAKKSLLRDYRQDSCKVIGKEIYEISFPNKDKSVCNIAYDTHVSAEDIMGRLINGYQYSVLMYDKSLLQAEFVIEKEEIVKERLVFMKKHNRIWSIQEIRENEEAEYDWFLEERGIPIVFRIDYAPGEHVEEEHAATHLTLSNHQSCRIPIKGVVTFSEFVRFILLHFYGIKMEMKQNRLFIDSITPQEKKMIHLNWE